jgi:NADH:ubiquinone oxidoreductase subunit 5 (subunit L)/multisubunit Na+/H+ antiporter MnhA subunit
MDPLSLLMLLVVTGVGSVIHIYSYGYMRGDPGFARYFASLSLFTFSMLGHCAGQQFPSVVHLLGTGRRFQLSC